jgi:hypothetical protein
LLIGHENLHVGGMGGSSQENVLKKWRPVGMSDAAEFQEPT